VLDFLPLLPYDALMFYAFFTIASAWSWGRRREVHDGLLLLFGMAVPIAAWLFSNFFPWAALLTALSYGVLWRWASEHEGKAEDGLRRLRAEDSAAAAARLRQAPDDGAARFMMAQELEKSGRWAEAMTEYEAAHRISDRMFPESSLAIARERLQNAIVEKRPAPGGVGARRILMRRRDWALVAACAALVAWSPPRAVGLLAALGFARWLTSGDDSRLERSSF
jgi:hypothetical protein